MTDFERRKILKSGGAALTIGLAGCIGPFQDREGVPGTVDPSDDDDENGGGGGAQAEVDEWLSEVSNYDGTIEDMTGQDSVDVICGEVDGTDQQFVFDPAAIQVDPGTTVTWEWSGPDSHSVTHENGDAFDSGIISGDGETFEHTFEEEGVFLYFCSPHRALNQLGAVVVGDVDGGGGGGSGTSEVDDWLSDVGNYDGSVEDMTGEDNPTVICGEVDGIDQQFVFDPAAIRVSTGTTVTWEWSGPDSHSVTHENGDAFDSGIISGDGETFEHTFEEAGTYLYFCSPHRALNQLGAVVVEE